MSTFTRLAEGHTAEISAGPMKSFDEIREALKRVRLSSGATQAAVAAAADLSGKTISAFEHGRTGLPWDKLVKMAEICGWGLGAYIIPAAWIPVWEQASRLFSESDDAQRARLVRFLCVIPSLSPAEQERLLRILEEPIRDEKS